VSQSTLDEAAQAKKPLVLFFQGEGPEFGDFYVYGADYVKLSKENATFIRFPHEANRDKAPDASIIPTSKLLGDNPARDYGVTVGKPTFFVTDWFGNPYFKVERKPSVSDLSGLIQKVPGQIDATTKKLQRTYLEAKAAWDKQARDEALRLLTKNFKEGVIGLEPQENSIRLYNEIMDAVQAEIDRLKDKGDSEGLKTLMKSKGLKGTAAAKSAEDALAKIRPITQEQKDAAK
jgi:hypothetical protein